MGGIGKAGTRCKKLSPSPKRNKELRLLATILGKGCFERCSSQLFAPDRGKGWQQRQRGRPQSLGQSWPPLGVALCFLRLNPRATHANPTPITRITIGGVMIKIRTGTLSRSSNVVVGFANTNSAHHAATHTSDNTIQSRDSPRCQFTRGSLFSICDNYAAPCCACSASLG